MGMKGLLVKDWYMTLRGFPSASIEKGNFSAGVPVFIVKFPPGTGNP